jgi:tetratricopeptide (TPR) repeat protein
MRSLKLILSVIIILAISISVQAKKPKWVKERPSDPRYYTGIGRAEKSNVLYQYVTEARNKALQEMSSEIKVNISANSILTQFENNYELKESFESKIQTSVTQTLEGYDIETWEDKDEYWVMMRLSKDKYEMYRRINLDNAKKLAATYYYDGNQARDSGDVFDALTYYVKAIRCIQTHIEEDLTYRNIDGEINLGVDIYKNIQKTLKMIHITPNEELYSIKFSKQMEYPLSITANIHNDQGQLVPIANLPMVFSFVKGEGTLTPSAATNPDGVATCSINRLISKRRLQEVSATLNRSALFPDDDECYKLLTLFFTAESLPQAVLSIEVEKAKAYLIADEAIFGEDSKSYPFTNLLKSSLTDNFFTFTPVLEDAEFVVKIVSEFVASEERKGTGYSVFMVYGDFTISITETNRQIELFSDGISASKGMQPGSFEHALKDCREKTFTQYEKLILPKLEQVDM